MSNHCDSHFERQEWCLRCQRTPLVYCSEHFQFHDFCPQCRRLNNMSFSRSSASRPTRKGTPSEQARGSDVLGEIADRLNAAIEGSPLENPRAFLRRADAGVLANLLNSKDFNTVMKLREADVASTARMRQRQASTPVPPSRDAIRAEVLRRHAEGQGAVQIAREMKTGRMLVQAIINKEA
jgi:hypothetical protein